MSKLRRFNVPIHATKIIDSVTASRICGLADSGEIEQAAQEAEIQFTRGAYGVALFTVWLAARFAQKGPAALPDLLQRAAEQIVTDAEQLGVDEPARSATLAEWSHSLIWFTENVRSRVRFHTKFHDDVWARWCAALTPTLDDEIENASTEFLRVSGNGPQGEFAGCVEGLRGLFYRNFAGLIPADELAADEDVPPSSDPESEPTEVSDEAADPPEGNLVEVRAIQVSFGSDQVFEKSQCSTPLRTLQAKLSAFEKLAGEQAWPLAAMVARDIERELGQFDPVRYFPQYFSNYLNTLCEVGAELEMHMHQSDSLDSQALERLYHADPERFLSQLGSTGSRIP